jgi:predicted enzyme related to lactoylglutathione lyase
MKRPPPPRLASVCLPVKDLKIARAFYCALLGSEPAKEYPAASIIFDAGGVELVLAPDLRRDPPAREGSLLSWTVANIAETVERIAKVGGSLKRGPTREGGSLRATLSDPFGNYVEVTE